MLCVGYRAQQIEAVFGEAYGALALDYSVEDQPLGTGGALRKALNRVSSMHLLAMNGDSFCDLDLETFAQFHFCQAATATIAVLHREDRSRSGAIELDAKSRVTQFESRPVTPSPGLINAGIYMLRRDALLSIPPDTFASLEDDFFLPLSRRGDLFGYRAEAPFIDIGTPESYHAAQSMFSKR